MTIAAASTATMAGMIRTSRLLGVLLVATVSSAITLCLPGQALVAAGTSSSFSTSSIAPTPPMGWSSWNSFGCAVDAEIIKAQADAMVASGMRDSGYEYVKIGDCWAASERDPRTGRLVPDPRKFPDGIDAVADYVHARGLKLGIYSSAGTRTCEGSMPGSLDHEHLDARTFAEWRIDYLTYDNCNNQGRPTRERYQAMGEALRAVHRPIGYTVNEWGTTEPWTWAANVGAHTWITASSPSDGWDGVIARLDRQVGLARYARPNAWNDPGRLVVGNGNMLPTEQRAHFALWALLNAPLIAGNDLRAMKPTTKRVLLNDNLIAVNQDWGGSQGRRVRDRGGQQVWAKPMSDGSVAAALFNRGSGPERIEISAQDIGLPRRDTYRVRNLWTGRTSYADGTFAATVREHDAIVFRIWPR